MPALNIDFTDDELAHVRERARSKGLAMRAYAHDVIVNCTSTADKDDRVMAALAEVIHLSEDVLRRLADQ